MRAIIFFLSLGILLPSFTYAQQTAYQALRIAAKGHPANFLDTLLVAEGLKGAAQPKTWRLIFDEPAARGGVREVEVSGGAVVAERTPLKNPFKKTGPIAISKLQLDSDGAFTAAENEALRRKIGFDSINYLLQASDPAGTPAWRIQLLDERDKVVSTFYIDARNALITGVEGNSGTPERRTVQADSTEQVSPELKIHQTLVKTGQSINEGVKHLGGSIQEIFTGERTIDKDPGGQ